MSHTIRDKKKLLGRVHRIQGQLSAIERALTEEQDPYETLQLVASSRGALNGLMFEIIEGHIRHHVVDPGQRLKRDQAAAVEQLIEVVRSYLK
ncbi:MAG: hypothetical protein AMXMBFR84_02970 [Candidatus Hydrogenedentota bacterium]